VSGSDRSREFLARLAQPIEHKRDKPVAAEVKGLTDVVKDIGSVKQQASQVAGELRNNIAEVQTALGLVSEVSNALKDAGAELRGALGLQTNNPPHSGG